MLMWSFSLSLKYVGTQMNYTLRKPWPAAINVERQNSWFAGDFNFLFKPIQPDQILVTLGVWQWWNLSQCQISVINLVLWTHFCREHIKPKGTWGTNAERCISSFHCLHHRRTHIAVMEPEWVILLASCPQRAGVKEILQYIISQKRQAPY